MVVSLLFVLVSWISVILCPTLAQDGGRELYFPDYYFLAWKHLENHVIISGPVKDLDECEYRCYLNANCVSLNIKNKDPDNGTHECELNNSTHLEHDLDLKDSKLYYYRGAENKCGKNGLRCKNNSTCQSGFTQKGYRCLCTAGFEGEHCEKDINECHRGSHNCHRNATCNNTKGGYNCSCNEGYAGDGQNCTDIDECANNPCQNGGTCIDGVNEFTCSCKPGFTGTQCKTDIDDCASNQCQNGGTCIDGVNKFTCSCKPRFTGTQCETVECPRYINLTDADRKYGPDTTGNPKCDNNLNGWYRFQGDAGRKMMTTCPLMNKCGGSYSAWLNEGHPTVAQGIATKKVCIRKSAGGNCCDDFNNIDVKDCGSYFVYKLLPTACYTRYCGTD